MSTTNIPLSERMRPKSLDDYIGQEKVIGKDAPLRKMLERGVLPSLIFWGPPGVGKTTLALLLANAVKRPFHHLSAIETGVKELREVINGNGMFAPVVFIDEIHRFNKSQQDALLGAVEKGKITLIGATTENPSFEVNAALLSRCQLFVLEELTADQLMSMANRAIELDEYLQQRKPIIQENGALLMYSGGDGRRLLNLLEMAVNASNETPAKVTDALVEDVARYNAGRYDKSGEQHYDIVSAFIKSMRASDPNGALYWLARMIHGGEDPKFIARRMLILASEDIGNANPTALVMADACFRSVHTIGYPECRIILSQCAVYLASSPKSNASYVAIDAALAEVQKNPNLPVPLHLRNAPTKLMKSLGYGENYQYAHHFPGNFVEIETLPDELKGHVFYEPGKNAREEEMRKFLSVRWKGKYGY